MIMIGKLYLFQCSTKLVVAVSFFFNERLCRTNLINSEHLSRYIVRMIPLYKKKLLVLVLVLVLVKIFLKRGSRRKRVGRKNVLVLFFALECSVR